jgi:hypothetical protein
VKKFCFFNLLALILSVSHVNAQISIVSVSGGGVEAAVKTAISNAPLTTVIQLTVTGTVDATDFRFIRDSLAHIKSLDMSGVDIVAYSGTGGTAFTPPPLMGGGGGLDVDAAYPVNTVPQYAFYKTWKEGSMFWTSTIERKMDSLITLVLPASAVVIDNYACAGMPALAAINLSHMTALTDINEYAFYKVEVAASVTFPNSLTTLGGHPFTLCAGLTSFTFPSSLNSLAYVANFFEGCTSLASVAFEEPCQVSTWPPIMFSSSDPSLVPTLLQTVTVPACVTNVGTAFERFMGTAIDCALANPVYFSKDGTLYLKSDSSLVAMPKGIASFTIPASMTVIPDNYFENCTNLTTVTILSSLTEIGNRAFYNCPITAFTFPSSLVKIGNEAFYQTKLTRVSFPNNPNLTNLGSNIFSFCDVLDTVDLSGLPKLGVRMFRGNEALRSVTLPSNVTKIPDQMFSSNFSLVSITLPNTVDTIGTSAFDGCVSLVNINMPTSLKYLGATAFRGDTAIAGPFVLPASFRDLPISSNEGSGFIRTRAQVVVDEANPWFASENGMLFNKAKTQLYHIPNASTPVRVTLPATVDSIAVWAFDNGNAQIKKMTLPASLKYIAGYGLNGANKVDTLLVKAITPPVCANNSSSLNNGYSTVYPVVVVPPRTKAAYREATGWKNYPDSAYRQASLFVDLEFGMANNISPNGQYVAGRNVAYGGYVYNIMQGDFTSIPGATDALDVNDSAWVAVDFLDSNYMINGEPLNNGGVWRNDTVYSVGLGRYGASPSISAHASVNAIDAAGRVYGMSYDYNSLGRVVPFSWGYHVGNDNYLTDTMPFAYPHVSEDQGSRIWDISSDGQVAAGWVSRRIWGGSRMAIGWTSPSDYFLFDENNPGEARGVSPNGKYIAAKQDNHAVVYDVEHDEIIVIGPAGSSASAVSNNGFVVGFHETETGRQAFIWSDRLGFMYFRQFIDTYMPDMEVPAGDFFNFPSTGILDVPMGISADGLTIVGWSGFNALVAKGWLMMVPDTLNLIDRAHNLTATVDIAQRNVVNLSWDAPQEYGAHTLDWYYIYRNGQYLDRFDASEGTAYMDNNAPAGRVNYTVAAVFDYINSDTYNASAQTEPATVTIVDNYNIPFAEGFESGTYDQNFWTAEANPTNTWVLLNHYYKGFNGINSSTFIGNGDLQQYNLSLTSKPFDATGENKVILAYIWRVLSEAEAFLGIKDTMFVEVGVGNTWTKVAQMVVNQAYEWTPVTLDISSLAANNLFRVRFHAVSGANRNTYNFDMDEFGLSFEESDEPAGVYAYRFDGETNVNVVYKDVTGSYGSTYTNGKFSYNVGNRGNSIIAVNRLTPKELKPYEGKKLTSVSAFLFADVPGTAIPSELKLAVFIDGVRVENTDIISFKGDAWNTFPLTAPIEVSMGHEFLIGIEAVHGDTSNRPLSMDDNIANINPNANLYSEDNGVTWNHASDKNILGHWGIVANFRDEAAAAPVDDDIFDALYQIYRNDVPVDTLHYGQMYVDTTSISDADCYKVRVFRTTGGMSGLSGQGCVTVVSSIPAVETVSFAVHPNPASDFINVNVDYRLLKIYDMNGRLMMTVASGKQINVSGLSEGTYLIEAILANGYKGVAKMIKK